MTLDNPFKLEIKLDSVAIWRMFFYILTIAVFTISIHAQTQISEANENTLIIENAPEQEIFAFGKTVIIKQKAKGVLSFGGDIIIEGEVSGEVATVGGSVVQKKDAFIGGDVFVIGGKYEPEIKEPLRNDGKETIIYAGYEEEIRDFSKNPLVIFSPAFTWGFIVQRLFSLLFWFGVSLLLTFITPGAIGRAVARFQLSRLKILGVGSFAFIVVTLGVMVGFGVLPSFMSGIISLMAFILLMLSYVFGRVVLQASIGKWTLKKISSSKKPSETIALFTGAFIWTSLLSIPYVWTIALFLLFTISLGLVLTAGSSNESWSK